MTRWDETRAAGIDSFVNLVRTLQHGSHVDALLDSIRTFFDGPREGGLVAAVSIVLSDVKWGRPDNHLLATSEVIEPVAAATRTALERWVETHAELAELAELGGARRCAASASSLALAIDLEQAFP